MNQWFGIFMVFLTLGIFVGGGLYEVARLLGNPNPQWAQWTGGFIMLLGMLVSTSVTLVGRAVERAKRCKHGTSGADLDPARCHSCVAEASEREERIRKEAAMRDAARRAEEAARKAEEARLRQAEYEEHLRRIRLPQYLSRMDPREYELTICEVHRRLGYDVRPTPYGGDSGVDGYLRRDGKLLILQCKRVQGSVGQPAVRDLYGTILHEHAQGGILVTTGRVSRQAREWASGKPIQFVEIEEILRLVRQTHAEHEIVPDGWKARP
jgi:HJR/Mrr/RecB family endonuclease